MLPVITPDHPLVGVRAKIEQAGECIVDFHKSQKSFLDSNPVTFTDYEDPNTGQWIFSIAEIKPVPLQLSLIIGEAIHHLRSALDLLACQLVKLGDSQHDCKDVYFPIKDNSEIFMATLINKKTPLILMGKRAIEILKELELYERGKGHKLWVLHHLDIQDKHRLLIVIPTSITSWRRQIKFIPSSSGFGGTRFFDSVVSTSFDDLYIPKIGNQIDRFDPSYFTGGAAGELRVHYQIEANLVFNEPKIIQSKSAFEELRAIAYLMEDTVKKFEPLFLG